MAIPVVAIGKRIRDHMKDTLFPQLVTDGELTQAQVPDIRYRKRPYSRGRPEEKFRISRGITIAPLRNDDEGGTNEREDIAYRYTIVLGGGTWTDEIDDDWPVATWEQAIRDRYQQSRVGITGLSLTNTCEIGCTVNPAKLPDRKELEEDREATALEFAVWVRKARRDDQ